MDNYDSSSNNPQDSSDNNDHIESLQYKTSTKLEKSRQKFILEKEYKTYEVY